jgi:hypothetical protein
VSAALSKRSPPGERRVCGRNSGLPFAGRMECLSQVLVLLAGGVDECHERCGAP